MKRNYAIPFLICILCLIGFEYFLLQEVFSKKRLSILLVTATGLILSVISFWILYKTYRKALK